MKKSELRQIIREEIQKLSEGSDAELDLSSGYTATGPKKNLSKAKSIIKKMEKEMAAVFAEYEDEGESAQMDARDEVMYDYEGALKKLGYSLDI